ncbi:aminotransferase class I/II-fold pyridoxal phosphate-dependent enzyme [Actinoplanes sp. NPDC051633]|uniref:aminotransferase class I/II-fold pyridoxal phosphate-dependent enzyme n=1 Tax=Actinoplanes sp. NPDC051633 TaxID=3155670 RepID=UPI003413551B
MTAQYQASGASAAAISASIESGVREGRLEQGAALPPVRALADSLGVSPATVAKAYGELRRRGVVEALGRRGTRVRSRPPVATPRSVRGVQVAPGVWNLSAGEPDRDLLPPLGPDLGVVAMDLGRPIGYADAGVLPDLAQAARQRLTADGVPLQDAHITVTSGTLDAVERLLTAHLRPGDAVAVEDPSWANLLDLIAALGMRAIPMALDAEGPVPDAVAHALSQDARAVVITSRAQNPTGAFVTAARSLALRSVLERHPGVLLIEDDHAAELARVGLSTIGPVTGSWAFIRSASKPYGPDLRIAVVAGDAVSIARVAGRMRIGSGWVSTVLQRLLLRLWRDEGVTAVVRLAAQTYEDRREALLSALLARGVEAMGATGINIWVRVPDETSAVGALREAGYAVAPGSLFRIESPPGVRVTISGLGDDRVEALADAIAAAVDPVGPAVASR